MTKWLNPGGEKHKNPFEEKAKQTKADLDRVTPSPEFLRAQTISAKNPTPQPSQLQSATSGLDSIINGVKWYGAHPGQFLGEIGQGLASGLNKLTSPQDIAIANELASKPGIFQKFGQEKQQKLQAQQDYFKANPVNTVPGMLGEQIPELPLWITGEGAITKLATKIPGATKLASKVPNIITGAAKDVATYGTVVAPVESIREGDNLQQFLQRESQLPSIALGGLAFRGAGKAVDAGLNAANPIRKIAPELQRGELAKDTQLQAAANPLADIQNAYRTPSLRDVKAQELANPLPMPQYGVKPSKTMDLQRAINEAVGAKEPLTPVQKHQKLNDLQRTFAREQPIAPERLVPGPITQRTWTNRDITPTAGPAPIRSITQENLGLLPKSDLPPAGQELIQSLNAEKMLGKKPLQMLDAKVNSQDLLPQAAKMASLGNGQKVRSFPISTGKAPFATPELTDRIAAETVPGGRGAYNPITLQGVDAEAQRMVSQNPGQALSYVLREKQPDALHTATGIRLIEHYQNAGDFELAVDVSMHLADALTKHGQAVSAARLVGQLSPEGILTFAARQVQKINNSRMVKFFGKDAELTPEVAQNLKGLAEAVRTAPDDAARIETSQELQSALNALKTPGIGQKLATTQTIAQLYNTKTQIRNIVGNELFYRLERLNKYPATLIDWANSKLIGADRTVTFRTAGQSGYWDGFLKGAKAGWKGVNVNGLQTQYDLGRGITFNPKGKPAEKVMSFLERSLGATMKGFDNAAYNRAYNQTIGEMATVKAINTVGKADKSVVERYMTLIDDNMRDIADHYGKYVTFQDNNLISRALSGIKRGLNSPTGGDFGLGDFIIKYPRTPGALIARGLDYSMAGFARSCYLLIKGLIGKQPDNREAMLALSRAITGTVGLTGMGVFLADVGILTGDAPKDYDIANLQKQVGSGPFRVNLSALKRFVFSGLNRSVAQPQQGDTLINYDWLQPIAFSISMGANIDQAIRERAGFGKAVESIPAAMAGGIEGAMNTVAEQPVLQGLSRLFQGYDLGSNITRTLQDVPASFAPTLLNQVRQVTDNTTRIAATPSPLGTAINKVVAKIPVLEKTLPPAYDTFGQPKQTYQNGGNSPANVFLNPAFVSQYNPSRGSQMVLDIFKNTGESKQAPRTPRDYFTVSGTRFDLSPAEYSKYQRVVGETTARGFALVNSSAPADNQVKSMVKALEHAAAEGKAAILRDRGIMFHRSGDTIRIIKR